MSRRALPPLIALLAAAPPAAALDPPADPCSEPAVLCPDLVMAPPSDLSIGRSPNGKVVLRAKNAIVNVGRGPMEVRASRDVYGSFPRAVQIIRRRGLAPLRIPDAGQVTFKFVDRYRGSYWKYMRAARFELWTIGQDGGRGRVVRYGPKLAYCLRDLDRVRTGPLVPRSRVYPACVQRRLVDRVRLGTSVGWADVYPAKYPDNWIDITGLRGCFRFVHRADPGRSLTEISESNNIGVRTIALPPRRGKVSPAGRC